MRIKFEKEQQKFFLNYAMQKLNCNLRELSERIKVDYERMKKYHQEICFFEDKIFYKICKISGINFKKISFEKLENNWGKVKGGKIGIKVMLGKRKNKIYF